MVAWVFLDADGRVTGGAEYPDDREAPPDAFVLYPGSLLKQFIGLRLGSGGWVEDPMPGLEPVRRRRGSAPLDLNADRLAALRDFAADLDRAAIVLSGTQCRAEELTWDAKGAAIQAAAAGRAKGEPLDIGARERKLLRIEAALVGETEAQTEAKIAGNAARFYVIGPAISAERRRHGARIAAATTPGGIDAENRLARQRLTLILAGLDALAADPEGFAAALPQTPEDLP